MRYKVTHRLRKQQDDQLVMMDAGEIQPVQNPQCDGGDRLSGSIVMGKLESISAQQAGAILPKNSEARELIWQRQAKVGDQLVYHHLRDDGYGRLSFFRASVSVSEGAENALSHQILDCPHTKTVENPTPAARTPEFTAHNPKALPVKQQSLKTQDSTSVPASESASDPSVRSVISVGLAVNLLALTVGGYLLQFSTAGTQANFAFKTGGQYQSENIHNTVAQGKIVEHTEKQQRLQVETHAHQLLQTAYNRAVERDFTGAVSWLKQIPEGTLAHSKVEAKLAEYTEKQQLQAQANRWNIGTLEASNPHTLPLNALQTAQQPALADGVLAVVPATGTPANRHSFNPGDILQEVSPQPVLLNPES